jgi:hypothetical protein
VRDDCHQAGRDTLLAWTDLQAVRTVGITGDLMEPATEVQEVSHLHVWRRCSRSEPRRVGLSHAVSLVRRASHDERTKGDLIKSTRFQQVICSLVS